MIREYDVIRLTEAFGGFSAGEIGTVLLIHDDGAAYEIEFPSREGDTLAVPADKLELAATGDWLP